MFVWAEDGTELKVEVPIVYKGEDVCPGLKKGWSLALVLIIGFAFPSNQQDYSSYL